MEQLASPAPDFKVKNLGHPSRSGHNLGPQTCTMVVKSKSWEGPLAFVTGYVYMYKRALYRDARRTHTKWFCIARERVPMQRERVLLPTKRFAITVRLVAKGRAWRAGVEAVHGERVCRAVRGTGLTFS